MKHLRISRKYRSDIVIGDIFLGWLCRCLSCNRAYEDTLKTSGGCRLWHPSNGGPFFVVANKSMGNGIVVENPMEKNPWKIPFFESAVNGGNLMGTSTTRQPCFSRFRWGVFIGITGEIYVCFVFPYVWWLWKLQAMVGKYNCTSHGKNIHVSLETSEWGQILGFWMAFFMGL